MNINIHIRLSVYLTPFTKYKLSLPSQQNPTTVPYNESHDYSALSDILFTKDRFNIILPYFFRAPISYFRLIYSGTSIYRFSRGWRKQTMNAGKRSIRETIKHYTLRGAFKF